LAGLEVRKYFDVCLEGLFVSRVGFKRVS
ncbi:MAG: hypothetical protein QOH96_4170, partial [Blastocatellia bacterium]|nr:hypothetical protein [Blastocatellia bacterium]